MMRSRAVSAEGERLGEGARGRQAVDAVGLLLVGLSGWQQNKTPPPDLGLAVLNTAALACVSSSLSIVLVTHCLVSRFCP